jgi:antitoxin (DNA-binding transcriptional repressor) of toxin-antitoxin stability system
VAHKTKISSFVAAARVHLRISKLSRVERGEEILITKRSRPVALLSPYRPPRQIPERQAAIDNAIKVMAQGLPWGAAVQPYKLSRAMKCTNDDGQI